MPPAIEFRDVSLTLPGGRVLLFAQTQHGDAVIDPAQTRGALITALEAAALNSDVPRFHPGLLQT